MKPEDLRDKAISDARNKISESYNRDQYIIKAVKFLDTLSRSQGSETESFRDLYSVHFPELEEQIGDDVELMTVLERGIHRDELDAFKELAESSTGAPLEGEDREVFEAIADHMKSRHQLREQIENYIEDAMMEEAVNLSKVLGPVLAAKLVSFQGSIEELAKKPSSTIQMLGAEKALFRYMKGEGTPPKHGILFEHKFVNSLPDKKRGKMARFMANKAAMAARLDQYGDKDKGDKLFEECRAKYESLTD